MSNISSDLFDGSNETGLSAYDSSWVQIGTQYQAKIYNSRLCSIGSSASVTPRYLRNVAPPSADYTVACDLYMVGSSTSMNAGPMARCVSGSVNITGYWCRWRNGTGIQLFRYNTNVTTQLGSTVTHSMTVGSTLRLTLKVEGAVISVYKNAETTPVISVTDASPITGAGYPGVIASSTDVDGVHVDNWTADTLGEVSDTTAPTLTSPTGTATGSSTASGTVSTDEANGTLYWLCNTSATALLAAVKSGTSQAVTTTGSQAVSVAGLTAPATYYLHYAHTDAAANDSAVVSSAAFTTDASADATPPTLTGTITASAITASSYTLSWPTGADNVAVTAYEYNLNGGSFVSTGTATTVGITGRTAGTTDTVTVRAKDAAGNVSTPVLSTTVNLLAVVVPGITTPVLKNNTGTILASETGVVVNVYNASTGALVLHKTGLTSDASGIVSFTDDALTAATSYAYEVVLTGGRRRLPLVTAA